MERQFPDFIFPAQGIDEFPGKRFYRLLISGAGNPDDKLVAADPGHQRAWFGQADHVHRRSDQNCIAVAMAVRIIDQL